MCVVVLFLQSPKDTSYETKEWEFHIIDVSGTGDSCLCVSICLLALKKQRNLH